MDKLTCKKQVSHYWLSNEREREMRCGGEKRREKRKRENGNEGRKRRKGMDGWIRKEKRKEARKASRQAMEEI